MLSLGPSHYWLLLCNFAIFVVTICVLASCRTTSESTYSLINIDRAFLETAFGEDCMNASIYIPDNYTVGLSGSCRVNNMVVHCESHSPPSLNWVRLLEADYAAANTTGSQADILEECMELIDEKGVDHDLNDRLAVALFALLVVSIILNITALIIAIKSDSAFGIPVLIPALLDEVILVVCIGIYMGIQNHEVGEYIPYEKLGDVSYKALLGVGFWMLLGIFGVRAISSPALFVITLLVAVATPLAFISLILFMVGCGGIIGDGADVILLVFD